MEWYLKLFPNTNPHSPNIRKCILKSPECITKATTFINRQDTSNEPTEKVTAKEVATIVSVRTYRKC